MLRYVKKLNSIDSNVIIWFVSHTPYLNPTSQYLLPSPLKPQNYTSPNKSALTHSTSLARIWWYKIYKMWCRSLYPRHLSLWRWSLFVCLSDVCLSDVCLSDVCLSDVCLSDICFSDVCLSDVSISVVYLSDVCLSDVCLSYVCLSDVCWLSDVFPSDVCLSDIMIWSEEDRI